MGGEQKQPAGTEHGAPHFQKVNSRLGKQKLRALRTDAILYVSTFNKVWHFFIILSQF